MHIRLTLIITIILIATTLGYSQNIRIVPPIGHTAQLTDVDVSTDGKYILSASVDKTLILWDYSTGMEIMKLAGTDYGVTGCVFSPETDFIYSAGWDGIIRKWSLTSLECELNWKAFDDGINDIVLFQKGKRVAAVGKGGILRIWNTKDGKIITDVKVSDNACNSIAVSGKGKYIAVGDNLGNLIVVDGKRFEIIYSEKIHSNNISSLDFTNNDDVIVTGSWDCKLKVTNFIENQNLFEYTDGYQMWRDLDVANDGNKLSVLTFNGILYEIDLHTYELIFKKKLDMSMGTALKYNDLSDEIVCCGSSNSIGVYRSIKGEKIKQFKGYTSPIEDVNTSHKGFKVTSAHWDSGLRFFDMQKCRLRNTVFLNDAMLSKAIFTQDDKDVLISTYKPDISIYNQTKNILDEFIKTEFAINSMALSKSEELLAIIDNDSTLHVYNIQSQEKQFEINHNAQVTDVCFSIDDKYIFTVDRDSTLTITEAVTGEQVSIVKSLKSKAESVAVSDDNKHVAVGLWTGEIAIVNFKTFEVERYIKAHNWIVSSITFSPVNDYLLSASWDKKVVLTDWVNDIAVAKYEGHTGSVTTCAYNNNGYYVITGGWDNQVKILDSRNLEEICSIIPVEEEDYLIITPDLYYMGTPDAAKKVSFASGLQTYTFEQFDLQYNRPDKVLEALPFSDKTLIPIYKKAYEKRLNKTGFSPEYFDNFFNTPQIHIKNHKDIELYTDKRTVSIEMQATDSIKFIDRYHIYINGVSIFGSNGKNIRKSNKNDIGFKEKIVLGEGLNKVEVSCTNSAGVESLRKKVEIYYSPKEETLKNIHVISLAVSTYSNSEYNLNYTINDGREIVESFADLSPEYNVIIDTLFGKECTRDNFIALKESLEATNVDDIVVLHFSGHGLLSSDGEFYFATYDVDFENPKTKGLEYGLIEGVLDGIPARNKLVLLDACHSGELDESLEILEVDENQVSEVASSALAAKGVVMYNIPGNNKSLSNSYDLMIDYFADVRKGTGAVVISAATGTGFALEVNHLEHGIFTYVLLNGLNNMLADVNNNGVVTVYELREYIFENVEKLSEGYQKPTARTDNLVNDFVIFK